MNQRAKLTRLFKRLIVRERDAREYGRLFSDVAQIEVTERPQYVRVRMESGTDTQALNVGAGRVPLRAGLAVQMIRLASGELVIDGLDARLMEGDVSAPGTVYSVNGQTGVVDLDSDYFQETEFIDASTGVPDAGKPPKLNADGLIDSSMLNVGAGNAQPYLYDSATAGDPGAGHLRLNNATPGSATIVYINDVNDNALDINTWLSVIGSANNQFSGYLHIWKRDDPSVFVMYGVGPNPSDLTTYWSYIVFAAASNGTFTDEDEVWVSFTQSGDDGLNGGNSFVYLFSSTTTDSDPGSGNLRFNHATFGSVTRLYLDDISYPNITVEDWIVTFDDSDSAIRGTLNLTKVEDSTTYAIFAINGASIDGTGYWKILVSPVATQGTISNGDAVMVSFSRTGDAGDAADIAAEIDGAVEQTVLEAANKLPLTDGGVLKWISWTNWLASLVAEALTWTNNVIIATTATTGNALRVIRNLTSTSTDAPVVDIVQDHASDDQTALRVQQDGTGDVAAFFDGADELFVINDGGSIVIGNDTHAGPSFGINAAAGTVRQWFFRTASLLRWVIRVNSTAESGSNVGSDLEILRRTDAGGALETMVHLQRATGYMALGTTSPQGKWHVVQATLGSIVQRLQSTATNDDPTEDTLQDRVATTDATVTTLHTYTIPASTTVVLEAHVVARRTGGVAGTGEDGAGYGIVATFKNVAGTATQIGATTVLYSHESVAGYDCVFDVTGATARVRVTGVASTNITWHLTLRVRLVSS